MAKPNYQYEKRQRELEKKKKKEDKANKKGPSTGSYGSDNSAEQPGQDAPAATEGDAPAV